MSALASQILKPRPLLFRTPWYYGWNVLAAGVIFQGLTWGIAATFTLFVAGWMADFHMTRAEIMVAVMIESIGVGLLSPFAGRIVDRTPLGLVVAVGGVVFALGMLLIGAATEVWHLMVAFGVMLPIGKAATGPLSGSTLAAKWFGRRRGLALGLSSTGTALGTMTLVPLSAFLLAEMGWRHAHMVLGVVCAAVLVPLGMFVIRSSPESAGVEAEPESAVKVSAPKSTRAWTTAQILCAPVLWIIVCTILPFNIVTSAVNNNMSPFLGDLGFGNGLAGTLIPLVAGCTIAGKIAIGTLADRIDTRILLLVAVGLMATALLILRLSPDLPLLYLGVVLLGFAAGAPLPLIGMIVANNFDRSAFGRVTGISYFFVLAFAGAGAVVGGYIRDVTGSYAGMFGALTLVLVPIVLATAFLPSRKSKVAQTQGVLADEASR